MGITKSVFLRKRLLYDNCVLNYVNVLAMFHLLM